MCKQNQPKESRRSFLGRVSKWLAGLAGISLAYPLLRFLGFTIPPKPRYITVTGPLPASGFHAERDFILFADNDSSWSVSRTCTHLGCRVHYLEDKHLIECPCHQSRFKTDGTLISGPARKNLPSYPVETQTDENGQITAYVVTL
ncbi:MAG: hypothetical protein DSY58_05610 [Desulfobulbus sp.]|nr:MAG: hypothetical protein DSY58_05610 [Desulfobulbus sp.]RUM40547.1 MAG: hypothetical protein DSY70_03300 [Desulfobulbus sp.]